MEASENIDRILRDWPYRPNAVSVRMVKGDNRREVVQMRIEMGILQLETTDRPDGERPHGAATFLDHIRSASSHNGDEFVMSEDDCGEADREFVQYYHRRICWLALREFSRAVADADHTLQLMDFCREHSPDEEWTLTHEQYRPFVLFHRTQAAALAELEEGGPESAIEAVNEGLRRLEEVYRYYGGESEFQDDELVQRLIELRESLREKFEVGRTLTERLADAIANEQYELAAKLRDDLARRRRTP